MLCQEGIMKAVVKENLWYVGKGLKPAVGDAVWADMSVGRRYEGVVERTKGDLVWVNLNGHKGLMYSSYDFKIDKKASKALQG